MLLRQLNFGVLNWFNNYFMFTAMGKLQFFKLLFGCPTANFEPISRRQPHSPLNHLHFAYLTQSLGLAYLLVGFEPGTFRF